MMQQYRCRFCGDTRYLFDNELHKLVYPCANRSLPMKSAVEPGDSIELCSYVKIHPTPMIVHGIAGFMTEHYMLDSIGTLHELNRVLGLEEAADQEVRHLNTARKNA